MAAKTSTHPKLLIAILLASLASAVLIGGLPSSAKAQRAAGPRAGATAKKRAHSHARRPHAAAKRRRCRRCAARPIAGHPGRSAVAPAVAVYPTGSASAPTPAPETIAADPESVYLGATIGGSVYGEENPPWDMRPLQTFEADSGHQVAILQVHQSWGSIYPDVLERIRARGAVPMLITEYNDLHGIVDGSQDAQIRAMNAALTEYGGPVMLRWDWEMNGDWYPWGGAGQAAEWVAAYRHLHDVLTAPNVSWIWNPNVYSPNAAPGPGVPANPAAWYPGNEYVDWMGADGYSYGTESFTTVFGPTYKLFQELAPTKPIILPEWAASNGAGRKAAYISEAFEQVPTRFPAIKAMVYYNDTLGDGRDWPLEYLPAAEGAYRAGSAGPAFSATPNLVGKLAIP